MSSNRAVLGQQMGLDEEVRLGRVLRNMRVECGWSQADVARRLAAIGWPLHQTNVSKLEAGKRPLRVADLYAFAEVFGVPAVEFFFMPAVHESQKVRKMRERLEAVQNSAREAHRSLQRAATIYAIFLADEKRIAQEISEAAKR